MWFNLLYMLPVSTILYNCVINEEIKMEGNLGDELTKLFKTYLVNSRLKLAKLKIHANIYATYPAGTNLWTIMDGIITKFHLACVIDEKSNGDVILKLEEGAAWRH